MKIIQAAFSIVACFLAYWWVRVTPSWAWIGLLPYAGVWAYKPDEIALWDYHSSGFSLTAGK